MFHCSTGGCCTEGCCTEGCSIGGYCSTGVCSTEGCSAGGDTVRLRLCRCVTRLTLPRVDAPLYFFIIVLGLSGALKKICLLLLLLFRSVSLFEGYPFDSSLIWIDL